jgi:hypothetical protein
VQDGALAVHVRFEAGGDGGSEDGAEEGKDRAAREGYVVENGSETDWQDDYDNPKSDVKMAHEADFEGKHGCEDLC